MIQTKIYLWLRANYLLTYHDVLPSNLYFNTSHYYNIMYHYIFYKLEERYHLPEMPAATAVLHM